MIDLTEDQLQALEGEAPPQVRNPHTGETFVLIKRPVYDRLCALVAGPNCRGWDDPELDVYESYQKKA
jgi:hypothetical protein